MRIKKILPVAALALLALPVHAADKDSITIYSSATPGSISPDMYRPLPGQGSGWSYGSQIPGYALVHEKREIDLKAGINDVRFSDVAALIDPTTVAFKSLTDPTGTSVLEQNFHFDLVSSDKLLERFLGQEITISQTQGNASEKFTGKLLSSAGGGLVLQDAGGKVTTVNGYSNVKFPELPGGLMTKPTLVWSVNTQKPGKHQIDTSYQTGGITWWADYNASYKDGKDENSGILDLGAWVSIVNKSGASYGDSTLKLIAGDVHRAPAANNQFAAKRMMVAEAAPQAADAAGFAEKAFFEFHLYTLGRSTSIPDNSTKQIELFPKVTQVPVEKQYIYDGLPQMSYYGGINTSADLGMPMNKKVDVYVKFKNDKKYGMGMPLPAGRIRVSKVDDSDNSMEFIGEDTIDHTPKDEDIRIKLGSAFDITGERKQSDFRVDERNHIIEETFDIAVTNHKEKDVNVTIAEKLYRGANWEITKSSVKFEKIDVQTVHFPVTVKKDQTVKVQYTVRYTW